MFTQNECVRVTFFEIPGAPRKNQCYSIFPGTLYIAISKCLVSLILICHDLPKEHVQRKSDIASFMEHPAYISFTMYSALILFFYFDFPLFTQNASVRVNYS